MSGNFVISLDFELMWGVFDTVNENLYDDNIRNVEYVLPLILKMFDEFDIRSTIAIVGFLFHKNIIDLRDNLPEVQPKYVNNALNSYNLINGSNIAIDNNFDLYFTKNLIDLIRLNSNVEICTHTFSHYLCLEQGGTTEAFNSDLYQAKQIAKKYGINIQSIIFPRNQYSKKHLDICITHGIKAYRGTEDSFYYRSKVKKEQKYFHRFLRLVDSYLNLSGHNCYDLNELNSNRDLINIPSSRFLRPYNKYLSLFEPFKLSRILNSMTYAAINKQTYHLWWHPHNFGSNIDENLTFLRNILLHYQFLMYKYNFKSKTLSDLTNQLICGK